MNTNLKFIFEKSRQELLDMGLRGNTLLNLGKGNKVLDLVNENAEQVFSELVTQSKDMTFLPVAETEVADESNSQEMIADQHQLEKKPQDGLQTSLPAKTLDVRLLKLSSEALAYVQEQGVDLLYLATGFIKWYESEHSDNPRFAPLVLIPVDIYRGDAGDAYKIRYTEAELGSNLLLSAKLKMEFGIKLPEFEEICDLEDYFKQIEQAIIKEKRWTVERNKIALSFFSFGKYQMYQDLSGDNWPEGHKPEDNLVIQKLFSQGFESDTRLLETTKMDVNRVEDIHLVLDSDSSQTEAVLAAKSGACLVIQGPPGTGKSQTITNIISQALADNKKILFVAEKMAALEVVKRRLDNCHLGDAVLELHSNKDNKKAVLSSIEATLLQHEPISTGHNDDISRLVELREKLDTHCHAVNELIHGTEFSYHQALGFLLKHESILQHANFEFEILPRSHSAQAYLTTDCYRQVLTKIQECVAYLKEHDSPDNNLYGSSQLSEFSPANDNLLNKQVVEISQIQTDIIARVKSLSAQLGLEWEVNNLADAQRNISSLRILAEKPDIEGINTQSSCWQENGQSILQIATDGVELQQQKTHLVEQFFDQAFSFDWMSVRGTLATVGQSWWRLLSSDFRRVKKLYVGMCRTKVRDSVNEWIEHIDALLNYIKDQNNFVAVMPEVANVLGSHYQDINTNWAAVLTPLQWINFLLTGVSNGLLDPVTQTYLDADKSISVTKEDILALDKLLDKYSKNITSLSQLLLLKEDIFSHKLAVLSQDQLPRIIEDTKQIYEISRFNRLSEQLTELGCKAWTVLAHSWQGAPSLLLHGFQYHFFSCLVDEHYQKTQEIRYFDRVEHENTQAEFSAIDGRLFEFSQISLVRQLFDNLPDPAAKGEVEILRREFNRKRRQMPIRCLMSCAGRAIQQIKPVFMMSPMSIATYLEPASVEFDLVIFDEASQVKVADALGAILRGKQVIVVGDTKQMPPTDFFGKQFITDDESAEANPTADMESILGVFLASGTPQRMLRWHYRSRHESLIALSNQAFYDNKLMVFPQSGINPYANGLSFKHQPNAYYDRGGARNNLEEAKAVARAVIQHAAETPELTLGVVAFSTSQRDTILLEVERLRKRHPELETFFTHTQAGEDFFVKNLENVQGDERDSIFISIGYGKTKEGLLPMSFGPLNLEGGERRLNVLITRARMSMQVFCNFTANEMPTTDGSPFGVRALKYFLHYAQTGELSKREETSKQPDSPFEEEVISVIQGLGYQVEPQVGCTGFYIDIAVRDPNKPGRYMLAVECDGASYHSSKSARDRDRIRQNVLEELGWRFHRIWSTDWFRNRHKETARLDEALKKAITYYLAYDEGTEPKQVMKPANSIEIRRQIIEYPPSQADYICCQPEVLSLKEGDNIVGRDTACLAEDIIKVVNIESPISIKQLTIRLLSAIGSSRSGARINRSILDAIDYLLELGQVEFDGEFVLSVTKELAIRNRQHLPAKEHKFEFVYEYEIAAALLDVIKNTGTMAGKDLVKSAAEILGFSATGKAIKLKLESVLKELQQENEIQLIGDLFHLSRI